MKIIILSLTSLLLVFSNLIAEDQAIRWAQFRGTDGLAVAPDQNVPTQFGPNKNLLWKVEVLPGHSSPVIWKDRIFLTAYAKSELKVLCLNRKDGSEIWKKSFKAQGKEEFQHEDSSPAIPTPCVDSKRLIIYFGAYGLIALDHDGEMIWEKKFPVAKNPFGFGASPILDGDSVYLLRDVVGLSTLSCWNAETGQRKWEVPRPEIGVNYSSPYVWKRNGVTEIVVGGSGKLESFNAEDGKEIWVVTNLPAFVCTSPVSSGNQLIFGGWTTSNIPGNERLVTGFDADVPREVLKDLSKFVDHFDKNKDKKIQRSELPDSRVRDVFKYLDKNRNGDWEDFEMKPFFNQKAAPGRNVLVAIRGGGRGNITKTHVMWEHKRALPYVASPVVHQGKVYYVKKGGLISCVSSENGKPFYQAKRLGLGGEYYATPVLVKDKLLVPAERGTVFVLSTDGPFEILERNQIGEGLYATPAVVDNKIYLRSSKHLWAFGSRS